jgi:hypothetical protein
MNKELLEAKIGLCKMIIQFMYERTDDDGVEYFDNYCESAGEWAFSVLGFEEDRIPKTELYKLYDQLMNELFMLRTGETYPISHLECYLKEWELKREKLLAEQRQRNLCSGCKYNDCDYCDRYDKTHCYCPCDNCVEEDGKMSNYYNSGVSSSWTDLR